MLSNRKSKVWIPVSVLDDRNHRVQIERKRPTQTTTKQHINPHCQQSIERYCPTYRGHLALHFQLLIPFFPTALIHFSVWSVLIHRLLLRADLAFSSRQKLLQNASRSARRRDQLIEYRSRYVYGAATNKFSQNSSYLYRPLWRIAGSAAHFYFWFDRWRTKLRKKC